MNITVLAEAHSPVPMPLPDHKTKIVATVVEHALETVPCAAVLLPTRTGATARMISRFKLGVWVAAVSSDAAVCRGLAFSYGVHPIQLAEDPENWRDFARVWLRDQQVTSGIAMLVAGPSPLNPDANHRIEFRRVGEQLDKSAS